MWSIRDLRKSDSMCFFHVHSAYLMRDVREQTTGNGSLVPAAVRVVREALDEYLFSFKTQCSHHILQLFSFSVSLYFSLSQFLLESWPQ